MENEIWKDIPIYSGLYEASNFGRIRSKEGKMTLSVRSNKKVKRVWKQRIIKQKCSTTSNGRKNAIVTLWKDGKPHYHLVCRLIATTFHENLILSEMTVNHIDGDTMNNSSDNLEWMTLEENIIFGFENGQFSTAKPIEMISENGERIILRSMTMACKMLGRSENYIRYRMNGKKEYAYSKDGRRYKIVPIDRKELNKRDA